MQGLIVVIGQKTHGGFILLQTCQLLDGATFLKCHCEALSYGSSKTQIENGKRHLSIWIFRSEEKSYLMGSDFDDFRTAFFDLAFSITTPYRNGGHFRSESMAIEKKRTRYQGVCMTLSHKPRELHQRYGNAHISTQSTRAQNTKAHTSIPRHDIVDSGVDKTAANVHNNFVAVTTTEGCCTILLPAARAVVKVFF